MPKVMIEALLAGVVWLTGSVLYFMIFDEVGSAQMVRFRKGRGPGDEPPIQRLRDRIVEKRAVIGEKKVVPGDIESFLTYQGVTRRYLVHRPSGTDPSQPAPVVLAFHGGMGHAESQRTMSKMNEVADRFGFYVVYPDGTGTTGRFLTFNAGSCCGYAARNQVDDVGFVRALLDQLQQDYRVNPKRVYATGLSNGAMLCYRLAAELSDRIAAIGPIAGGMGVAGPQPSRPVPVIHFHGMKDQNVPFLGGVGARALDKVTHRSIPDTIAWWARANRCLPKPAASERQADRVVTRYSPAEGQIGAPVVLYALPEGGHNWPGGVDTTGRLGTGKMIVSVDASTIMWKFFERHTLDGPVGPAWIPDPDLP
jgi:polyhydroxybutyrate depolymerase